MRPMFGPLVPQTSITFVSQVSIKSGVIDSYKLRSRVEAVKNCRKIGKKDMKHNGVMPKMKVDPERYVSAAVDRGQGYLLIMQQTVEADGKHLTAEPSKTLPLAQAYFVF